MMPMAKEDFRRSRQEVPYRVADSVLGMIEHRTGDLMKDSARKIDAQVLLFRNAWDHFPADKQAELARNLYQNMAPGSVLIIGAETIDNGIRQLLKRVGFSQFRSEGPLSGVFTREVSAVDSNPFAIAFRKANLAN
jgi:chemotaxis methyl-accepting protein methylase